MVTHSTADMSAIEQMFQTLTDKLAESSKELSSKLEQDSAELEVEVKEVAEKVATIDARVEAKVKGLEAIIKTSFMEQASKIELKIKEHIVKCDSQVKYINQKYASLELNVETVASNTKQQFVKLNEQCQETKRGWRTMKKKLKKWKIV